VLTVPFAIIQKRAAVCQIIYRSASTDDLQFCGKLYLMQGYCPGKLLVCCCKVLFGLPCRLWPATANPWSLLCP